MNVPCSQPIESLGKIPDALLYKRCAPKRTRSDNVKKKTSTEHSPGKKGTLPSKQQPVEFRSRFDSKHPGFRSLSSSPSRSSPRRSKQKFSHRSPEKSPSDSKRRLASMTRKIKKFQREIQSDQLQIDDLAKENKYLKEKLQNQPETILSTQELMQECQSVEEKILELDSQLVAKLSESQDSLEFFLGFSDSSNLPTPDLSWVPDFARTNLSIRPLPALATHRTHSSRSICSQRSSDELYFL